MLSMLDSFGRLVVWGRLIVIVVGLAVAQLGLNHVVITSAVSYTHL